MSVATRLTGGAITMNGTLRVYKARANGTSTSATAVTKGWAPYL